MEHDILSQIYSGSFDQTDETQNFGGNLGSYAMISQSQSQSQSSQQFIFVPNQVGVKNTKGPLSTIEEEDTSIQRSQIIISQKQAMLSQQIDQLYNESQKINDEEKVVNNQFEISDEEAMNLLKHQRTNPQINHKNNNSKRGFGKEELKTKNESLKKSNLHHTSGEINIQDQGILNEFKWKMNEFRTSLFNLVNESKQSFCELADKTLNKLLDNMNNIEMILANETENTLRNQVIDQKIDILFKEIFNFLNDLNSRQ
jgi:hypothetical protein